MRIRPFARADTELVVQLWERCDLVRPSNDPRRDIARKLAVDPERFLVAVEDADVVGSVMVGYDGHRGWVYYLAVDPSVQGRGIGRALMDAAEHMLRGIGCAKLNLQVRSSNTSALGFYARLGYARDDVVSLGKRFANDSP